MAEWVSEYSPTFQVWYGPTPVVFILDPKDIKLVLNHPEVLHKGKQMLQIVKPYTGDSLIVAHRKQFTVR